MNLYLCHRIILLCPLTELATGSWSNMIFMKTNMQTNLFAYLGKIDFLPIARYAKWLIMFMSLKNMTYEPNSCITQ